MMRTTFLATATSVAFFGLTLPTFAADNAQPAPTAPPAPAAALSLSQALLQAQVDKCLADGSITAQQVHAMADKELIAALDTCSKVAAVLSSAAAEPSPAVEQQAAPPVNEPSVRVARSSKVAKPKVAAGVPAQSKSDHNLRPTPLRSRPNAISGDEQTGSVVNTKPQPSEFGVSPNGHFSNFWETGERSKVATADLSENGSTRLRSRIRSAVREFVKRQEASSSN
jgi:hypothetical protein